MKKVIIEIASFIIGTGLIVGAWLLGYNLIDIDKSLSLIIALILLSALIVAAKINIVKHKKTQQRISELTPKSATDFGESKKQKFEQDYKKAEKKVNTLKAKTIIYNTIIIILLCAFTAFSGAADTIDLDGSGGLSLSIISLTCLLCQGLIAFYAYILISPTQNLRFPIKKEEYPALWNVIDSAAKEIGYKGRIQAYLNPQGISISETPNSAIIGLCAELVALKTKTELYSVLLHEFAHYANEDTKQNARNFAFTSVPEKIVSSFGRNVFISELYTQTIIHIELFDILSSKNREIKADETVKNSPFTKEFINSIAKATLYNMYKEIPWGEICYDVYSGEKPVTDFTHRNLENFKQKYKIYSEKWNYTLSHELPARVDSHPTFKERAEKFGLAPEYTPTQETDPSYTSEQEKLLCYSDRACIADMTEKKYAEEHNFAYLERKKCMEAYDFEGVNADFLPLHEKLLCAQALMNIDDQKALVILNEIIEQNPATLAILLKAMILAKNYDDGCIELFNKAAEDPTCTDNALEQLALYALKTGNQAIIDEYRAKGVDKNERSHSILKNTSLYENELIALNPEDHEIHGMLSNFICYWGDNLSEIHGVECYTEDGIQAIYFALTPSKKCKVEEIPKAYDDSMCYVTRLMNKSRVIYIIIGGREYKLIKSVRGSLLYRHNDKK